jgi:zinc transport system substrate-binding protein
MKKINIIQGGLLLAVFFLIAVIAGCAGKSTGVGDEKRATIKVAATIFPLADIVRNVGGDNVAVEVMLAPGASPHTFEARPSDVVKLQSASLLFAIGHGVDNWAQELADGVENLRVVTVDNGIVLRQPLDSYVPAMFSDNNEEEEGGGQDPHYWLSVKNAKMIAQTVADILETTDAAHKDNYANNLQQYITQLESLDSELSAELAPYDGRGLITFHDAWGYFTADYKLNIIGMFEPSPGKEPSPQYLKQLNDTAVAHNIKAVFTEPQLASGAVEPFVQDLGLKLFTLDPLGGTGEQDSYINLMRYNARTIRDALTQ